MATESIGETPTLFLRKATGLVRGWSVRDSIIYAALATNFVTLGMYEFTFAGPAFPKGQLITSILISGVLVSFLVIAYAGLVGWGTVVRAHQALIFSLRDRAERAEADQARRVSEARAAERARIAREMHDVLAHRLSLLATYAGALAYRPDAPPDQVSRAAEVVRSGVHQALDELREVIGVLRDDSLPDLTAASRPLPGLPDLPELIGESRAAGMRIEMGGAAWSAAGLPDVAGRTAYRVVQEGLTNARKHAPGEPVTVTLGGGPGAGLDVSVVNQAGPATAGPAFPVPGSGTGLIGLTERLELAGGKLEWRNSDGEFRLSAWLPWPEAEDPEAEDNVTRARCP